MPRVLRIPLHDNETSFVLLHSENSADGSSRPLDLTLVGTEGESPYVLPLKHNEVSSLKSKNAPCSEEEWATILECFLLGKAVEDSEKELLNGVEAIASVAEDKSIDVTIRKRTEGITQRLGSFHLQYDERQDIQLFDWCGVAVQSNTESLEEISTLKIKFQKQRETINKLNAQLEELIAAKAQHETELLYKFRDLLNEKKSKIRDQQRLLSTAKVDPKKLASVQASRDDTQKARPGPSRSGKRKAPARNNKLEDEDDSEFEKMDVDADEEQIPNDSSAEEDAAQQTPDDDETASEDDADDAPPVKPPARSTRKAAGSKATKAEARKAATGTKNKAIEERLKTPPRRDLPFAKKHAQPALQPQAYGADEETASEDDEL